MLNDWSDYKELNVLPYGGKDLMSQPAFILEGFKLIEETRISSELEKLKASDKKAQRRK